MSQGGGSNEKEEYIALWASCIRPRWCLCPLASWCLCLSWLPWRGSLVCLSSCQLVLLGLDTAFSLHFFVLTVLWWDGSRLWAAVALVCFHRFNGTVCAPSRLPPPCCALSTCSGNLGPRSTRASALSVDRVWWNAARHAPTSWIPGLRSRRT